MQVQFKQTTDDYYNAIKHVGRRLYSSTKWRFIIIFSGVIFGFLLVHGTTSIYKFYKIYGALDTHNLDNGLIALLAGVVILIVGFKIYLTQARPLIFAKDGVFLSLQTFVIDDDYLIHFLGRNESHYLWDSILEVEKTKTFIFMFIDRGAALYIPRHAFNSDDEYAVFYNALHEQVEKQA